MKGAFLWRARKFLRSLDNWRRGFAFGYVRRCRVCGHTAYQCDVRRRPWLILAVGFCLGSLYATFVIEVLR